MSVFWHAPVWALSRGLPAPGSPWGWWRFGASCSAGPEVGNVAWAGHPGPARGFRGVTRFFARARAKHARRPLPL